MNKVVSQIFGLLFVLLLIFIVGPILFYILTMATIAWRIMLGGWG